MVCTSAEELQARLALRALWQPAPSDDAAPTTSIFHRHMRAEFDEVLKAGLSRRISRLESKVNRLIDGGGNNSNGQGTESPKAATNGSSPLASASTSVTDEGVQTTVSGETVSSNKLADAFEKAYLHAVRSTWPIQKKWGPSRRQNNYTDPPEKEEKLEKELTTIKSTMGALNQNLSSRERQIVSLKAQLGVCKEHHKQAETEVAEIDETLRLARDPAQLPTVHSARRKKQQEELENLEKQLVQTKAEGQHYQSLSKQQHAFFMQADTIYCRSGVERMHHFPAGEVFLVPQPLPMEDEKADSWDVGTSFANPYEVDSWPFEPNVLARRYPKECPMDGVPEETLEELMESQRPGRTNPFRGAGLNLRAAQPQEDDEDFDGPVATSRSL